MAKFTTTLTGTTDNEIVATAISPIEFAGYGVTLFAQGTFDSGAVTFQISPDNGATKYTAVDTSGTAVSFTADGYANIVVGNGAKLGDAIKIYADLAGASGSAAISIIAFDVR